MSKTLYQQAVERANTRALVHNIHLIINEEGQVVISNQDIHGTTFMGLPDLASQIDPIGQYEIDFRTHEGEQLLVISLKTP